MIKHCYMCGAKIDRMFWDEYIYKADVAPNRRKSHEPVYFCGWNCMRKYEKEREEKRRPGRTKSRRSEEAD